MIIINIQNSKKITAIGHANYSHYGQDIVCAAVSAVLQGGINALESSNYKVNMESGYFKLDLIQANDHDKIVLETMTTQLLSISHSYSDYVKVNIKGD